MPYFINNWESDCLILYTFLQDVEFYSGSERRKMLKNGGEVHTKHMGSMLYGITWKSYMSPTKNRTKCEKTGLYKTKCVDMYPQLENIFKEFASLYFSDFEYRQVQCNLNFKCPRHKDTSNIGESVLVALGDYTGGNTIIEFDTHTISVDARLKPIKFNGSKYYHSVEPFQGNRISLVFFDNLKPKN